MAKAAAPYVPPSSLLISTPALVVGPIQTVDPTKLSGDELDRLERIFGPLAGFGDDDAPGQAGEGAAQG